MSALQCSTACGSRRRPRGRSLDRPPVATRRPCSATDRRVASRRLADGAWDAERVAHREHVPLGRGLCPCGQLAEQPTERLGSPQRPHARDPGVESDGCRQSLLHARRQQPVRRSRDGLVARPQQCRRLDAPGRQRSSGRQQLDRPSESRRSRMPSIGSRLCDFSYENRDLVTPPSLQSVTLQRGQSAERASRSCMQDARPHQLLASQDAGRRTQDDAADLLPASGVELRVDVVVGQAEAAQLPTRDQTALGGGRGEPAAEDDVPCRDLAAVRRTAELLIHRSRVVRLRPVL